jgi:putative transposase
MSTDFPSRKSLRMKNWNYGFQADYFVTVCTENMNEYFGEIVNGKMILNDLGKRVEQEWLHTPEIRKDMNLKLDDYQVMPNHFHGILTIGSNEFNWWQSLKLLNDLQPYTHYNAKYLMHQPLRRKAVPQRKNLSSIIRGFKSAVTTYARKNGNSIFNWHSSFHDYVIPNKEAYNNISSYIRNNPKKWKADKYYSKPKW